MSHKTPIKSVSARRIWDSRGRPTVEAEVILDDGSFGRGNAPAGASRGIAEAVDLRDGGDRHDGMDVTAAIINIEKYISPAIMGLDASNQQAIDDTLLELDPSPNKATLGGNAMIAVSLATLNAAAAGNRVPLWQYLSGGEAVSLPIPEIQIFGGGAHADRRVDIQDFMIMPLSAQSYDQALRMTADVYRAAGNLMSEAGKLAGVADEGGWWPNFSHNEEALDMLMRAIEHAGFVPGQDVGISLDVAASEFFDGKAYVLGLENKILDTGDLIGLLGRWIDAYPIVSIEDPLAEEDHTGMRDFTNKYGDYLQIIGDDYLVTNASKVRKAAASGICNAVLIKPNQAGTVSETKDALEEAKKANWGTVVSARSGETEDVTIVHLAVGWNSGQLKVGSFARSERMAKWNEGLRIAERMGRSVHYTESKTVLSPR